MSLKFIGHFKIVFIVGIIAFLLISCKDVSIDKESDIKIENKINKVKYNYYDIFNLKHAKIIVPQNQSISQSLSIVINDGKGSLIVFDGGRVEDANFLIDIIKDNGGKVKSWYITHIHDDHIGALYKILEDKRNDILIENLYYDFADFDWYYKKMGNDAGIYYLFTNAIQNFNNYLQSMNKPLINIYSTNVNSFNFFNNNVIDEKVEYTENSFDNLSMQVNILNSHFELDQDPINNTSIVYEVEIYDNIIIKILIFGDLGYEGGEKLFNNKNFINENSSLNNLNALKYLNINEINDADIIVLSHHGQNGIDPILYKNFKPKVVVWPTSKDIYENTHGRYYTNETKDVLKEIDSIECQIKSYEETAIIR